MQKTSSTEKTHKRSLALENSKRRMLTYDDKEKVFGLVINPTMVKLMYGYLSTAVVGVVLGILK